MRRKKLIPTQVWHPRLTSHKNCPFALITHKVVILDVVDGWVLYKINEGGPEAMPVKDFMQQFIHEREAA